MSYRCPECKSSDGLYEEVQVPGWRSVDEHLQPTGDRDVEWHDAEPFGNYGCSCGFGPYLIGRFEKIGVDGEPLPVVHPDQITLA